MKFLPTLVFVMVHASWFIFIGVFLTRKKPPKIEDRKRNPGSIIGLALQGLSYAIVWAVRRPAFTPIAASNPVELALSVFTIIISACGVMLVMTAIRTLGKEWSLTARVVEGHKLAIAGPYAFVRHPIYTAMLAMLVATGLAVSHWLGLVVGLAVFLIGTSIRIRSEEQLLRETFGDEFAAYVQRVPALIPGIY
jgi:protein-S-isoprenylcysteine O-methyltransferase Ste14